jgi:rhodanese-related sulfurtransferase
LLDVRTPAEFEDVHAENAINVPLDQVSVERVSALVKPGAPLLIICKGGTRGRQACEKILAGSSLDVRNIQGGTDAWRAAGLPVREGRKTISLERQVRIAAGTLVVLGIVLSFAYPGFIGISAFVGFGLIFTGVTDTCAMAMLLAKMPWNQRSAAAQGCATSK